MRSKTTMCTIVAVTTALMISAAGAARAQLPDITVPRRVPPVPLPLSPCISTGTLLTSSDFFFICFVRNVGTTTRNVTIELRDSLNQTITSLPSTPLNPGISFNLITGGAPEATCVVTTDEGTANSLSDLAVTLESVDTSSHGLSTTEGRVFNNCAQATQPPS
jgi:hypothetical protein